MIFDIMIRRLIRIQPLLISTVVKDVINKDLADTLLYDFSNSLIPTDSDTNLFKILDLAWLDAYTDLQK